MNREAEDDRRAVVRAYHERTKHHPNRPAASLGYMDWANQPNPFRTFADTEAIDLPHPGLRPTPTYDGLFAASPVAARLDADFVGRLFYHSLALSAWKQIGASDPWSLRINPSSGALYPTEGYLISGPVPGLSDRPGVYHYAPYTHRLECRGCMTTGQWERLINGFTGPCVLIGLASIYWREAWKYGERAFRYCQHDVGHAIGALTLAARTLGWQVRMVGDIQDENLNRLIGTHLQKGPEAEQADCLLVLSPASGAKGALVSLPRLSDDQWRQRVTAIDFRGEPNRLSPDQHMWPVIDDIARATRLSSCGTLTGETPLESGLAVLSDRGRPAEQIIRQRRSAVAMDGRTGIALDTFYQMLQRTLPAQFPFKTIPWPARIALVIFVHRIANLKPGLYLLIRNAAHEESLRRSLHLDFEWQRPEGCPRELQLFRLRTGDLRHVAQIVACRQDIAGEGAFALGMVAQFDAALTEEGAACYPRLYWETGLIGQVLYLEAEAAGVRGTGIGCFYDDAMHTVLGLADRRWQSLYHFTIGGPVVDSRLKTLAPYHHLDSK